MIMMAKKDVSNSILCVSVQVSTFRTFGFLEYIRELINYILYTLTYLD